MASYLTICSISVSLFVQRTRMRNASVLSDNRRVKAIYLISDPVSTIYPAAGSTVGWRRNGTDKGIPYLYDARF